MASNNEIKAEEREALRTRIYRLVGPRGEAEIVMERLALGAVVVSVRTTSQPLAQDKDFTSHAAALEYMTQRLKELVMEGDV